MVSEPLPALENFDQFVHASLQVGVVPGEHDVGNPRTSNRFEKLGFDFFANVFIRVVSEALRKYSVICSHHVSTDMVSNFLLIRLQLDTYTLTWN